jgi:hypothetical protein
MNDAFRIWLLTETAESVHVEHRKHASAVGDGLDSAQCATGLDRSRHGRENPETQPPRF